MIWLLTRVVVWPTKLLTGTAKVGAKTGAEGFKTGYKLGALLGYRRMVVLGVGVGIGMLVAPVPGRQLREKLKAKIDELSGAGPAGAPGGSDGRTPTAPVDTSPPADASPADASPAAEPAAPPADNPPSTVGAGAGEGGAEGSAAGVQDTTGTEPVG